MILFLHGALARKDKGRLPRRIRSFLLEEGLPFRELSALNRGDYLAEVSALGEKDVLLALGGDGTLSLAADALMAVPEKRRPLFLLVPGGTLGDGARNIWGRIPLRRLLSSLKKGRRRRIDVLRATLGEGAPVHFLYMASAGRYSWVASRASRRAKSALGRLSYLILAFFEGLCPFPNLVARLQADGIEERKEKLSFLLVLNGRRIGGLPLRGAGPLDDGKAEVRLGKGGGLSSAFRTLLSLRRDILQTSSIFVKFAQMTEICIDGEPYRSRSLGVDVLPGALEILTPSE